MDPGKGSSFRSFKKIANRLPSNQDAFRGNYGVLLLHTLDFKVTGNWTLVQGIAAAVLVCTAFSLHEEEDKATLWGTETAMLGGKNHKLVVVVALALLLLYVVTFGPRSRGLWEPPRLKTSSSPLCTLGREQPPSYVDALIVGLRRFNFYYCDNDYMFLKISHYMQAMRACSSPVNIQMS